MRTKIKEIQTHFPYQLTMTKLRNDTIVNMEEEFRRCKEWDYIFDNPSVLKMIQEQAKSDLILGLVINTERSKRENEQTEFAKAMESVNFKIDFSTDTELLFEHTPVEVRIIPKHDVFMIGKKMLHAMISKQCPTHENPGEKQRREERESLYNIGDIGKQTQIPKIKIYAGTKSCQHPTLGHKDAPKCSFCLNAGYCNGEFGRHTVNKCPFLLNSQCPKCKGFGHTRYYCSIVPSYKPIKKTVYEYALSCSQLHKKTLITRKGKIEYCGNGIYSWKPLIFVYYSSYIY